FFRKHPRSVRVSGGPPNLEPQVAAIDPTQLLKSLREPGKPERRLRIVFAEPHQHADARHPVGRLRADAERGSQNAQGESERESCASEHRAPPPSRSSVSRRFCPT